MTYTQAFQFLNQGNVKGGNFVYTADPDSGRLTYSGKVTGKLGFFSKDIPIPAGEFIVDPMDLRSDAFKKPGDTVTVGPVTFTAIAIQPGTTTVTLQIPGGYCSNASAELDTTGPNFRIRKVLAHVKYSIFSTDVEADEIIPGLVFA